MTKYFIVPSVLLLSIAAVAASAPMVSATPYPVGMTDVHRFYNIKRGTHFYTASDSEAQRVRSQMSKTYRYEGVGYHAFTKSGHGRTPLYRFYQQRQGTHFYTTSPTEMQRVRSTMSSIYRYEGVPYYVGSGGDSRAVGVHRFFNRKSSTHFYTISQNEANRVRASLSSTYRYENISFRAFAVRSFKNCTEANSVNVTPLYKGQPGYGTHLDRDRDGIACEWN